MNTDDRIKLLEVFLIQTRINVELLGMVATLSKGGTVDSAKFDRLAKDISTVMNTAFAALRPEETRDGA